MRLGPIDQVKKYTGILLFCLVIGFAAGLIIGPNILEPSTTVYYQKSLVGIVRVDSLPDPDGSCPYQPGDNTDLDSVIVTDGVILGYPLGHLSLSEFELQPEDGLCKYGQTFPISISPTGRYELMFSESYDSRYDSIPTFAAEPGPNPYVFGSDESISPGWIRWFLTTISCPDNRPICPRIDEN